MGCTEDWNGQWGSQCERSVSEPHGCGVRGDQGRVVRKKNAETTDSVYISHGSGPSVGEDQGARGRGGACPQMLPVKGPTQSVHRGLYGSVSVGGRGWGVTGVNVFSGGTGVIGVGVLRVGEPGFEGVSV